MYMIRHELKEMRKSLFFWCVGIIALMGSGMAKFEGAGSSGQSMNELMQSLPKGIKAFMGVGDLDVATPLGFYGILFIYFVLMATIHAAMVGGTILSKETMDKTVEFLFVKPISRSTILINKLIAAISTITVVNLVILGSSLFFINYYNSPVDDYNKIIMLTSGLFLLQLLFFFCGFVVSATVKHVRAGIIVSTTLVMVLFFLSIAIDMSEKMNWMRFFTPFKYFEAKSVLMGEPMEVGYVIICLLISGIGGVLAFVNFNKRDLV